MAEFHDVASDMAYLVKFENANKLWSLSVKDSPAAPIDKKVKQEFFKSECFKKTCLRAIEILTRSKEALDGYVSQLMKNGKLLKVDELKFNKIMKYISDQELMKNLRLHKFMH